MAAALEGQWKNFEFRIADSDAYPMILEHLHRNVYEEELLNKLAGNSETKANELDHLAIEYMEEGLSFYAQDTVSKKIAGVRVIREMSKDAVAPNMSQFQSPEMKKIVPFILNLQEKGKVFDVLGVHEVATLVSLSIEQEFRQQGLATEFYRRTIAFLKAKMYPAVEGCFSSPYARKIAQKMGFQELSSAYVAEYKDAKGEVVFPNATPEDFVSIMALKLT